MTFLRVKNHPVWPSSPNVPGGLGRAIPKETTDHLNSFWHFLLQDWQSNSHDIRIRFVLVAFRLATWIHRQKPVLRSLLSFYLVLYRVVVVWLFHMELHWKLSIGEGLCIHHGFCLIIHPDTLIGKHVTLLHGVTLGNKGRTPGVPTLEDHVEVGAHAIIIGPVIVGQRAIVGAGAVVTKHVPPGVTVAGNPAKIISQKSDKSG
jgi:putative colanic acid biosynthesis acetyltransferase WcaB